MHYYYCNTMGTSNLQPPFILLHLFTHFFSNQQREKACLPLKKNIWMHHSIITVSTKPVAQRDMLSKVNADLDIRPDNCITCDPIGSFTLSEGCRKTRFIKFSILYFQKCCVRYYFNPRMRRP